MVFFCLVLVLDEFDLGSSSFGPKSGSGSDSDSESESGSESISGSGLGLGLDLRTWLG